MLTDGVADGVADDWWRTSITAVGGGWLSSVEQLEGVVWDHFGSFLLYWFMFFALVFD